MNFVLNTQTFLIISHENVKFIVTCRTFFIFDIPNAYQVLVCKVLNKYFMKLSTLRKVIAASFNIVAEC